MRKNARLYIMEADDGTLKLGHSVAPSRRAKELRRAVSIVHTTDVLEHAERIERLAHRVLALHGRHIRGEWFEATLDQAVEAIEIAIRQAADCELKLGWALTPSRPAIVREPTERFEMRMSASDLAALDRLRKGEDDLPSRAEMIRRLIVDADGAARERT